MGLTYLDYQETVIPKSNLPMNIYDVLGNLPGCPVGSAGIKG